MQAALHDRTDGHGSSSSSLAKVLREIMNAQYDMIENENNSDFERSAIIKRFQGLLCKLLEKHVPKFSVAQLKQNSGM